MPVLRIRKSMRQLSTGDVLRVLADDPAAVVDIPHYCAEQGHTLLNQEDTLDGGLFVIRKG